MLQTGLSLWHFILGNPIWAVVIIVGLIVLPKFLFRTLNYWYAATHKDDLVYMQVTLPRKDSKLDQEKQTEKDFKEKVGVMEQFYRNIHEIRELNLWNRFKSWLVNHDMVSFELVLKNKELYFYVVTYKYFKTLIEKQITSYYPDADITYVKPYELGKKGDSIKAFYLYERRKYWFPVKTYKTLENDPLNDITNVFSKLQENDFASIQIVVNSIGKGWCKKAEREGAMMFKGKKERYGSGIATFLGKIPIIGFLNTLIVGAVLGPEDVKSETNQPGARGGDAFV